MEKISASKKAFVVALVFASGLAFYGACFVRPPGANSNIHVGEDQAQLPSAPRAEIAGVTERLTNEYYEDLLSQLLADEQYQTIGNVDPSCDSLEFDFLNMLSNRRCLKLTSLVSKMSDDQRRQAGPIAFRDLLHAQEMVILGIDRNRTHTHKEFTPVLGRFMRGRVALCWAMYVTAKFSDPPELIDQVEQINSSCEGLVRKIFDSQGKKLQVSDIRDGFPDRRAVLNMLNMVGGKAIGQSSLSPRASELRVKYLPLPEWDSTASTFEANLHLFDDPGSFPSFVDVDKGWVSQRVVDWPSGWNDFRRNEDKEMKIKEICALISGNLN